MSYHVFVTIPGSPTREAQFLICELTWSAS